MKKNVFIILAVFCTLILFVTGCSKSAEDTALSDSGELDTPYENVPVAEIAAEPSPVEAVPEEISEPEEEEEEKIPEEPFEIEGFDINDINPAEVIPSGVLSETNGETKYCAVAPLPFTKMYESPDENSLVINFCDSIYPAITCTPVPENDDFYYVEYGNLENRGFGVKGYVKADQIVTDCNYAYTIQELDFVDETGNPSGGKLANHTLVVWKQDVGEVAEIYTFDDGTVRKAFVPAGYLCDLTKSTYFLFKYNQVKETKKIEDPLLYNLTRENILWRYCEDDWDRYVLSYDCNTGFLRKEYKAVVEFSEETYRPMEYDTDIYSILKTPYDEEAVKKLEAYAGDRTISWGIFPQPSVRISCYDPMSFIGDSVIPQGTIVARIQGSRLYHYVDPATGEIMQTYEWNTSQEPEMRKDYKDDMKAISDIYAGRVSDQEAREFFWQVFDKDMDYPDWDDPNFTRHIEKYRNENFGTDFSDGISDILEFPGKAVVKAGADGAKVYSRPGTIGLVLGTVANGTELVPSKLATHWYSWGDDGWYDIMFFYIETDDVSGWVRACDCVASGTFEYTHGGSAQNEWERDDYATKGEPMGPETATPDSGGGARFPVARGSYNEKKAVPELTEIVPYGGTVMAYCEEPRDFNPKFCYVITDSTWSEPTVGYADELLTKPAVEIPDLTPLLIQSVCLEKTYGYKSEYSLDLYSVEVVYEGKRYWISRYSYFSPEEPFLPYEK